tara:strand:- start:325 stop:699 length:375 start_codon:yes stop_codon:yes gene_type:complete
VPKVKILSENRAKKAKIMPKKINGQKPLGHNATAGHNATPPMGQNATLSVIVNRCEILTYNVGQNAPNALWQNATVENCDGAKCHMPKIRGKELARCNLFDSNDLEKYVFFFILFPIWYDICTI